MNKKKIRIIIADDHPIIRQTWKLLIESDQKIEVIAECSDGIELIELLTTSHPDIILMDINMSPVNGFEATRRILKQWPEAKIIGISIHDQAIYARNLLQLGAKGYVTKDSTKAEMISAILAVYEGREYICEQVKNKISKNPLPGN